MTFRSWILNRNKSEEHLIFPTALGFLAANLCQWTHIIWSYCMRNLTEFHGKLMARGKSGDVLEVFTVAVVDTTVFWNVTLLSGKLHSSIEKDGGSRFFWNVSKFLPHYMIYHHSSSILFWLGVFVNSVHKLHNCIIGCRNCMPIYMVIFFHFILFLSCI